MSQDPKLFKYKNKFYICDKDKIRVYDDKGNEVDSYDHLQVAIDKQKPGEITLVAVPKNNL